jgi:hypothetical protein
MAVPTITSITPDQGHAGGVLVQIVGTGFRIIAEPPAGVPAVGPTTARVEVEFSGGPYAITEAASSVGVWSSTELYCTTPSLDPFRTTTAFAATAADDLLTSVAHGLADGTLVELAADVGGLDSSVGHYVVNATADTFQLSLSYGGAAEDITADASGSLSSDGAYSITVRNIDDNDDPIAGEEVTVTGLFRPLRPNLSTGAHIVDVIEALVVELKRQCVANVSITTHTDYDEESGDIEVSFPARLPHLVVTGIEFADSTRQVTEQAEDNYNDVDTDGDFVVYRPAQIVDLNATLVGVADNPAELLALLQVTKAFFRKTYRLRVARTPGTPADGYIYYDLRCGKTAPVSLSEDNTNLGWFTLDVLVRDVRLEQIPGMPARVAPGLPTDGPTEAIIERGKTAQIDTETFDGLDLTYSKTD